MKSTILFFLFFVCATVCNAQKWQQGHFTDTKNNRLDGLIDASPSGKGPIKGEGFIVYKESKNAPEIRLSASDLTGFVAGADSFAVAHPPMSQTWQNELDFVKVVIDEPLKLYAYKGGNRSGGGSGFRLAPSIGIGAGSGGYGGGYGGAGVGISLGGGNGGSGSSKTTYYYGATTAELTELNALNFEDIMSEIMGDDTEILEGLREHRYSFNNLDKLIKHFKQKKAAGKN